ncbi:hypothetical protein Tco_0728655, partial [Tanacetum coccineum]
LRLQLERDNLLEVNPRTCLDALRTLCKEFFASKRANSSEHLNQCWQKDFKEYTLCEPDTYRRDLLENLDTLEAVIHRAIESENHNALSKSVNETQLQQHESLVTESTTLEANLNSDVKALDDGSVITESSETKSDMHDTSNSSRTYITHVVDANIRPVNDQVPSAEVHFTAPHNVHANEQQHTDQSEPRYDTYLLEKVDSNTTPDSTNMSHRGGEIDQDAKQDQVKSPLLKAEFFKSKDMVEKEVYNELSKSFLQLEKHCISLKISMQQKEESFQSNKPCMNQDSPEFCEFFEINDLKAQLHAKTTLILYICQSFKGKTRSLVTKKTDISYVRSSRNSNMMNMLQMTFGQNSSGPSSNFDVVWTKQFKPRSSSNDVWTKQFKPRSSSNDVWTKQFQASVFNLIAELHNLDAECNLLHGDLMEEENILAPELQVDEQILHLLRTVYRYGKGHLL